MTLFSESPAASRLQEKVPHIQHTNEVAYSKEIIEYIDAQELERLPFPALAKLLLNFCSIFSKNGDVAGAIGIEQLVDGMDLDMEWLRQHLPMLNKQNFAIIRRFIDKKGQRMDEFNGNEITCFIRDSEEARQVRRIPGRNVIVVDRRLSRIRVAAEVCVQYLRRFALCQP